MYKDRRYISTYAEENISREDVAESASSWYAVRVRPDRQASSEVCLTEEVIPHRMDYFDKYFGKKHIPI